MPEPTRLAGLVLLAAFLTGCGGQGVQTPAEPGPTPSVTGSAAPSPTAATPPARLVVPAIGVDEQLIDLGIADNGELEVPEDPDRVGWFTGGGKPGETLPVVMAGHVDSRTGPAVFARLPQVAVGDEVTVTDSAGATFTYRVHEVRDVPQDADFPTADVYAATVSPELRLITCTGDYDRSIGRYTENRVVFATLI